MRALNLPVFLSFTLLSVPSALAADKIYKSVDEQGNVIYSEKPLRGKATSKEIVVQPPPSPEDVRRAEEQARKTKEKADAMEAERKAREEARRADTAVGGARTREMSGAAKATGISEHPRLPPEELDKYLKDPSYVPPPVTPSPSPPPR